MGSRVPDEVQVKLKEMFQMNVAIPSLTHYVEWVDSSLVGTRKLIEIGS